ncbi:leucine-rich melanocyte differentiation-associated protein-like [Actinia tenebrosa]|uniref:Leucine-rich melanocyte differentiation-associated protein-like n=1 Tax=Actinia tenebrosa TaxID=6105 RepID=A0A6P8HE46_ACTTE|nr:leucine-rich melanocyte differentiation-associated protein-like [Actinia tenebrosa]
MESNTDGIVLCDNQLSFIGQEAETVPGIIGRKYGKLVTRLDLSFNNLRTLNGINSFELLEELILDNNQLGDDLEIPPLPHLKTLSMNKNKLVSLEKLLEVICKNLPNLTFLSMLGNTACPNELSGNDQDEEDYQRYRYYVLYKLPKLKFLDSRQVKEAERQEAKRVGVFMKVVTPTLDNMKPGLSADTDYDGFKYTPLPNDTTTPGKHRGTFGECRYVYYGKHSEGNRFIRNNHL